MQPDQSILEAYEVGHRTFGENKVKEMTRKWETLPKDIEWHMIGDVQTNKIKYMASFVSLINFKIDLLLFLKIELQL